MAWSFNYGGLIKEASLVAFIKSFGLCLTLIFWAFKLLAAPQEMSSSKTSADRLIRPYRSGSDDVLQSSLRWETLNYVGANTEGQANRFDTLFVIFNLRGSNDDWSYATEMAGISYTNLGTNLFYVNQLYARYEYQSSSLITFGRKKGTWSILDETWDLGIWEPLGQWDPLRPFHQGLTGVFWEKSWDQWEMTLFASPVFIPTMAPPVAEENGNLVSVSRWYKSPSTSGPVLGRDVQFVYALEIPELARLVTQNSFAATIKWQNQSKKNWARLSWAQKPINQLLIQYDYNLALASSSSQARVKVAPTTINHQLVTAESGFKVALGELIFGVLHETPFWAPPSNAIDAQGNPQTDWIRQQPSSTQGFYGRWNQTWFENTPQWSPLTAEVSFLHLETAEVVDRDAQGQNRGALFPDRWNWSKALQVRLSQKRSLFKKPFWMHFRSIREWVQKGNFISLGAEWHWKKNLHFYGFVEAIGIDDGQNDSASPGFFNQFRTNDRLFIGVNYVF